MTFKMKYLLLLVLIIVSCQSTLKNKDSQEKVEAKPTTELSANQKWKLAINANDVDLLATLYTEKAFVLSNQGVDLSNRNQILELVKGSDFKVGQVATTKRIKANPIYDYEIGNFTNKNGGLMKHVVIWKTNEDQEQRELEFLAEANSEPVNLDDIVNQRAKWISLCNTHDVTSLIETMYTENTMYYNRGRLLQGRERLTSEYQYMSNPEYNLTLEPILVEPVSSTIVYEFGQCKGSYNGKYILVWQKDDQGVWRILFDSNI